MKRLLLLAAIGFLCGSLNSFAQHTAKVQNVPGGTMVSYDNLSWSVPSDYFLSDFGPEGDETYCLTFENGFDDYISLYIYPLDDSWKNCPPKDNWDYLVVYLESYLDEVEEYSTSPVVFELAYDKCETDIQAAGQEYRINGEEGEEFFYVEYCLAGKYGILAESAAWEKEVRDALKAILHSIRIR